MTPDEFPPEDNLALAQRRAERALESDSTVVGFSVQAALAGMSLIWALMALPSARDQGVQVWPLAVAAVGVVIAVTSWLVARRRRLLQPFPGTDLEHPFGVLSASQQRTVTMQLRGRTAVSQESAPLLRAMILGQRRATRVMAPTLVGAGMSLLGAGGSSTARLGGAWSWLLMLELGAVAFVVIALAVESRRRTRVLERMAGLGSPEGANAGQAGP